MSHEQAMRLAEAVREACIGAWASVDEVDELESMESVDLSAIVSAHLPDLEQQAKDAVRYKWLRDQFWVEEEARFRLNLIDTEYSDVYHIALDEAIDAAMKESGQ